MSTNGRQDLKTRKGLSIQKKTDATSSDVEVKPREEQGFEGVTDEPIGPGLAENAESRKKDADLRRANAGIRKKATGLRQRTAGQREDIANLREATADQREEFADRREAIANHREAIAEHHEGAAASKSKDSAAAQALLKEANERLIISSIHAQAMAESAELANEKMSYMAGHDYLTGLPNRSLLNDRMAQSIALAQRHSKKVALMYMDLDHFKNINDSLGHAVGDELLKSIAKRLQACVRNSDTICRQGGDEFVVLLNDIEDAHDAVLTAEKIIESMGLPHTVNGQDINATFSIGISVYPDDGDNLEIVARKADTAMYQAKAKGRNTYQRFIKEMEERAQARQFMEQQLRSALVQNRFVLHYQPKISLETGSITGIEALIRIVKPDNSLVYPDQFISIAEECGLILPIGRWVLFEACRQAQSWLQAGLNIGQVAVNVSFKEFHSPDFLAGVISVLKETGLDPSYLELEITESGLMKDTEHLMVILATLKKVGVRIAIDDFGTGYSSLSYLTRFPLDTLKIDQSFVKTLDDGSRDTENAIISAVIAMGESLKYRVVAEGIETKQQVDFLKSQHCNEGQGFYFSRPLAADDFTALMSESMDLM